MTTRPRPARIAASASSASRSSAGASGAFDQTGARNLVSFAKTNHLGELSFWELTRDRNACTGALYMCTNIAQTPYEFSKIFVGFLG